MQTILSSFRVILLELNRSMAGGSHYNLYDFHRVEKIHALVKARASHPRTIVIADPTGSSRLFTDPEEERVRGNDHSSIPVVRESFCLHLSLTRVGPLYGYIERCTVSIRFLTI